MHTKRKYNYGAMWERFLEQVYLLDERIYFPPVESAKTDQGILAKGGDLSVDRLLFAYQNGIFPWYSDPPILWYSPTWRFVLFLEKVHTPARLRRFLKKHPFTIKFDFDFHQVISSCAQVHKNTWINQDMIKAYNNLFKAGFAFSVESWWKGRLVGGIYGVRIGKLYSAESMFYRKDNASKVALFALLDKLREENIIFLDCQIYSEHMANYGAEYISRQNYLNFLKAYFKL